MGPFFPVSLPLHTKLGVNNHFNAVFTQGERASCGGFFFLFNSGTILIFIQVHLCGSHTNTTHCQSNSDSWKNAPSQSPLSKFKKPTECVAHFEFNSKGPWMQSLNVPFVERLCRYFPGPMLKPLGDVSISSKCSSQWDKIHILAVRFEKWAGKRVTEFSYCVLLGSKKYNDAMMIYQRYKSLNWNRFVSPLWFAHFANGAFQSYSVICLFARSWAS